MNKRRRKRRQNRGILEGGGVEGVGVRGRLSSDAKGSAIESGRGGGRGGVMERELWHGRGWEAWRG